MRELKFRVWDRIKKQMVYEGRIDEGSGYDGYYCTHLQINFDGTITGYTDDDGMKGGLWEHEVDIEKDRLTLMQSIGLLDKNGKEIYDGDIIDYYGCKAKIEWNEDTVHYEALKLKSGIYDNLLHFSNWCDSEVIGNIYENPELLEN